MWIIKVVALLMTLITLVGTLELLFLTLGSLYRFKNLHRFKTPQSINPVVLIPSHNEEEHIAKTLDSLMENNQDIADLQIVVIADNCTDQTEKIARSKNIRVLTRNDPLKKGKGYALNFAFETLLKEDFSLFIVIDADSLVEKGYVKSILEAFLEGAEAVQTANRLLNFQQSHRQRLLNLAFLGFDYVRPLGRNGWGLSAGLFGNGFALSRKVLIDVPYTATGIVEDLEYHLKLVEKGYSVKFLKEVSVYSEMPASAKGFKTQRARWEGGRYALFIRKAPEMIKKIYARQFQLLEPLADLMLLPLGYHAMCLLIVLLIPFSLTQGYALFGLSVLAFHVLRIWALTGYCKEDIQALVALPGYLFNKLITLLSIPFHKEKEEGWVRTERKSKK